MSPCCGQLDANDLSGGWCGTNLWPDDRCHQKILLLIVMFVTVGNDHRMDLGEQGKEFLAVELTAFHEQEGLKNDHRQHLVIVSSGNQVITAFTHCLCHIQNVLASEQKGGVTLDSMFEFLILVERVCLHHGDEDHPGLKKAHVRFQTVLDLLEQFTGE